MMMALPDKRDSKQKKAQTYQQGSADAPHYLKAVSKKRDVIRGKTEPMTNALGLCLAPRPAPGRAKGETGRRL